MLIRPFITRHTNEKCALVSSACRSLVDVVPNVTVKGLKHGWHLLSEDNSSFPQPSNGTSAPIPTGVGGYVPTFAIIIVAVAGPLLTAALATWCFWRAFKDCIKPHYERKIHQAGDFELGFSRRSNVRG